MDDLTRIRYKTTSNMTALPDTIIQAFLEDHAGEQNAWMLALADCLEYLARDDVYGAYSRGGISYSQPLLREQALYWRARAGDEGAELRSDVMVRVDEIETTEESEFSAPIYLED